MYWINVGDRLPKLDDEGYSVVVLCYCPVHSGFCSDGPIATAAYSIEHGWHDYEMGILKVTHWCPLPTAPIAEPGR